MSRLDMGVGALAVVLFSAALLVPDGPAEIVLGALGGVAVLIVVGRFLVGIAPRQRSPRRPHRHRADRPDEGDDEGPRP